ncbi:MAG: hypothetical protein BWY90_01037 [Deltaproteobacteria bacterium ADurb.BinA014]|nr:MAG: hypothetical protein BWY90_01037 [Deltaproteobacteria bacterium ADurb.BinA014]
MIIIEKFTPEFQIKLIIETLYPLENFRRLLFDVFFVIESFVVSNH